MIPYDARPRRREIRPPMVVHTFPEHQYHAERPRQEIMTVPFMNPYQRVQQIYYGTCFYRWVFVSDQSTSPSDFLPTNLCIPLYSMHSHLQHYHNPQIYPQLYRVPSPKRSAIRFSRMQYASSRTATLNCIITR